MSLTAGDSYDEMPYSSLSYPNTHPRNLEAIATLFGMQPPAVPGCRVLALGCAGGGNLFPMAEEWPEARFVGVDLSPRQIAAGCSVINDLGLTNVELRVGDILDIDDTWGQFDYVICHGVYSWVPPKVQAKILEICRENLVPNGVAVVSYNTYPGWHMRGIVRDMMRYHVSQFSGPRQQALQARAVLDFMVDACAEGSPYGALLREELERSRRTDDSYVFHEYLESVNQPKYFHEFAAQAEQHGLQFLAESNVSRMLTTDLPESVQNVLDEVPLVRREQYIDFFRNVRFRSSLLCHETVDVTHELSDARLGTFAVQLSAKPLPPNADYHNDCPVTFDLKGSRLTVGLPLIKAALVHLGAIWPEVITVPDLHAQALAMLGRAMEPEEADVSLGALHYMLRLALHADALELFVHPPQCVRTLSERPMASPLARYQVSRQALVTNRWHRSVKLDDLGKFILERADGEHDIATLEAELADAIRGGRLVSGSDHKPPQASHADIAEMVRWTLNVLAEAAFLVA